MFDPVTKSTSRRAGIREKRPSTLGTRWRDFRAYGGLRGVGIAAAFAALAVLIVMLRDSVVPYRPGQYVPQAILSRVEFTYHDNTKLHEERQKAREAEPRVYKYNEDVWNELQEALLRLPDRIAGHQVSDLPASLQEALETSNHSGDLNSLYQIADAKPDSERRHTYESQVKQYVQNIRKNNLLIATVADYREEMDAVSRPGVSVPAIRPRDFIAKIYLYPVVPGTQERGRYDELREEFESAARIRFSR
jgi:hypothetical protein